MKNQSKFASKFSSMMQSCAEFFEYGTRGWLICSIATIACFFLMFLVPSHLGLWIEIMLLSLFVMMFFWGHDYAKGYVPLWFYQPRQWLANRRKRRG